MHAQRTRTSTKKQQPLGSARVGRKKNNASGPCTSSDVAQRMQMQALSAPHVQTLRSFQRKADTSVAQLAKKKQDYASPTKHGNQKGTFVGAPHACHIHIVSNNTHFKVGRTRIDFEVGNAADGRLQEACDEIRSQYTGRPGAANCLAWLLANGAT